VNTKIDHIAVAVWDIDASLPYYEQQLGFKLIEDERLLQIGVRLAYLDAGNVMIQLVQPLSDGAIKKFLDEKGEGLHHICLGVENIPQFLEKVAEGEKSAISLGGRSRLCTFLANHPNGLDIEITEFEPYQENSAKTTFLGDN